MVTTEPNFKKKFTEGNARNLAFIFSRDVTKIRKTRVASRVGIHFGARSCESKSKLELFQRLFIELFCHIFLALGLNTSLNGV